MSASAGVDLLLVAMPWAEPGLPSIQVGTLKAVCERAGFRVGACSFYLTWTECLLNAEAPDGRPYELSDYLEIASKHFGAGLGDWVFGEADAARDAGYLAWLRARGTPERVVQLAVAMRPLVSQFLARCSDEVLAADPRTVGFTTAFDQSLPSLALAEQIKRRRPGLHIVFGGANCDGSMGAALHRSFACIDTVVRGEAERVLPELLRDLVDGAPIRPQSGLCYRDADGLAVAVPQDAAMRPAMADVPVPDYDEYFVRVRASSGLRSAVLPGARLPFEGARGCWWGERSHCTFCGLNGTQMAFASKSADRVAADIEWLSSRYRRLDLEAVDNIIDREHVHALLPRLRELRRQGYDFRLFYETKANLSRDEVRLMRDAGVLRIQPGIESLSTPILRLMRKGVTALQNVRLLKWAAQFGVTPVWNIIYGFPGEPPEEYPRMAASMPALSHLRPPALVRLRIQRFSPYHVQAASFGLVTRPAAHYRFLYDVDDETFGDLAYDFDHEYADGREPNDYVQPVAEAVARWDDAYRQGSALRYERGPGFLRVVDERPGFPRRSYVFDDIDARVYMACDAGATAAAVWRSLGDGDRAVPFETVAALLDELAAAGLVFQEGDRYLSLATAMHADASAVDADPAERPGETFRAAVIPVSVV